MYVPPRVRFPLVLFDPSTINRSVLAVTLFGLGGEVAVSMIILFSCNRIIYDRMDMDDRYNVRDN